MGYFNSVVVTNETGNKGITGRRKLLARFQEDKLATKNLIDSSYQNKKIPVCLYIGVALLPLLSVLPAETSQSKLNGAKCSLWRIYTVVPVHRVKDDPVRLFITLYEIFTCARCSVLLSLNFLSSLRTVVSRFQ